MRSLERRRHPRHARPDARGQRRGRNRPARVVAIRGTRARTLAVSGVDEIDPRGAEIQSLQQLAQVAGSTGETLDWSAGEATEMAPQLHEALDAFVDRGHAAHVSILPVRRAEPATGSPAPVMAILVAEWFADRPQSPAWRERFRILAAHAQCAMRAVDALEQVPLLRIQQALGRWLRWIRMRPGAFTLGLCAVVAVATALALVPADFTISAAGTLEPSLRRHVYSPADGVVTALHFEHGESLPAAAPLLKLHNPQLSQELSRLSGEIQTATARLAAIRVQRAAPGRARERQPDERQLAAEEQQVTEQLQGLQAQHAVLEQAARELNVTSPIAGVVLTWNPKDRLLHRPVKRGQRLLTLADPDSAWVLELRVADKDIGHVLTAQRAQQELPVEFLLASDTAVQRRGRVTNIEQSAEATPGERASVRVTASLDEPLAAESLAGASITAKIHCGRRSLAYVWLHELWDAVRRNVWF